MNENEIESRQDYYRYVKEFVDIIEEELEDSEEGSGFVCYVDCYDYIHEQINSDRIITHYGNSLTVLENSDNEPEEWKHLVDESSDYREVLQALAYDVFRQDIWEEVKDRDLRE